MNFFRSEEHLTRWLEATDCGAGVILSPQEMCDLAHAWWGTRLAPDWRPRTLAESQEILDRLGLVGEHWRLA